MADQRLDLAALSSVPPLADLIVRGVNNAADPRLLVVRVDDRVRPDYTDRANEERVLPPGPFTLRLRLASLRTSRGRELDLRRLQQIITFTPKNGFTLEPLRIEQPGALPSGTHGWFFGPSDAAPLLGFRPVALTDAAVSGPALRLIHRPSQDPILAWGMRLTRFEAAVPPGKWHVTLWTEDPGEWETLPMVLERRIRINGVDVLAERGTEDTWIRTRYFAGRDREVDPARPAYEALGAYRGGRIEADVTLPDGRLVLELAGHPPPATHLAAMTLSPADHPDLATQAVEAVRAARFAEAWPILGKVNWPERTEAVTAPGGIAVFRLSVRAATAGTAHISVQNAGDGARLLWGMWRWRRPAPDVQALTLSPAHLRDDSYRDATAELAAEVPLRSDLPRPLVVLVPIAADATPGARTIRVVTETAQGRVERLLRLEILPVRRPEPVARVGVFLDFAPHLVNNPAGARAQAASDLDTLRGLGLTAVAPPLAAPGDDLEPFLADLRAAAARFRAPLLAYAPARRQAGDLGADRAAALIARADAAARAAGLPPPVWTVADEPSGAGTLEIATDLADRIRLADRNALLAGHLNDDADHRILQHLNLVTVNPRFGVDASDIASLREGGQEPWLYNMPAARLAAGFYLWRSGAAGLLQWHGRMPTADAFDPTDGREGDAQFLWPTPEIAGPSDLDAELLDLVEAEEDLRWLAWLDSAARSGSQAAADLLRTLRAEVPSAWIATERLSSTAAMRWRSNIVELARELIR